jgi:hypothetical protein
MFTIYPKLLAVISVGIFYSGIPNYVYIRHGLLVPLQWLIGFGVLALPLIVRQIFTSNVFKSPVVAWCFLYTWITIIWFIPSSQSEVAWQEVRWRVLTVLELVMFLTLLAHPDTNKQVRITLVAVVLLGVALNIYELFFPLSFSSIIGRSAGFYMNPTTSALALVGGMIFAVTVLPAWFRGTFILLVGLGVAVTFSRGGIMAWCVATVGFLLARKIQVKEILLGVCFTSLLAGALILPRWGELLRILDNAGVTNSKVEERLLWLTDPSDAQDASSEARAYVTERLWGKWAEDPFLGSGTGSAFGAFEIPPHNQYLVFMVDHGFIGSLVFPLLILSVIYRNRGKFDMFSMLFGCTQALAGLVSHTLVNEPQTLLLFALAATVPITESDQRWNWRSIEKDSRFRQVASQSCSGM